MLKLGAQDVSALYLGGEKIVKAYQGDALVFGGVPTPAVYTITATIDPAGSGTVTGAGRYQDGETVTLKAEPADGYKFTGWRENGQTVSTDTEYSFMATGDRTFVVAFAVVPPSRLPAGYTELEYIQSDSHSGIKTDVEANFSTRRIVMDIEPGSYASGYEAIMYADSNGNYFFFLYRTSATKIMYRYSSNYGVSKDISIANKRIVVDWDFPNDRLSIGGTSYTTSKSTRTIGTNVGLLGTSPSIVAKLYSAKIYTSDTLEADYVPCTNPSGAVGVYDLVSKKFYANAGTGTFTAGPAV